MILASPLAVTTVRCLVRRPSRLASLATVVGDLVLVIRRHTNRMMSASSGLRASCWCSYHSRIPDACSVNAAMTAAYWLIGRRIVEFE